MSDDISLAPPPDGLDALHDVMADLDHPNDREYSNEEVLAVWRVLPRDLRLDAHRWGVGDTVVRDSIYVHLKETRVP